MNQFIAYCGLDCSKCEAYIATANNDDGLRRKVAKEWSELNNVEIIPEMINCDGCRMGGRKTVFCDSLCPIRQCALKKGCETRGQCSDLDTCQIVKMVHDSSPEALQNLKG